MEIEFVPLASFVLATTFSPGPNNISSASIGILCGFRDTFRYLVGIMVGFFIVMLLCGWVSSALLQLLPTLESPLRLIGAAYILWLAFHTLKASYGFSEDEQKLLGFNNGLLLQLLNPKVIIYGLALYTTFLSTIVVRPLFLLISALVLASVGFCAVSTWTIFGTAIRTHLKQQWVGQVMNTVLFLLLVYTAAELSGVFTIV